jgi:hypothetical protein
VSVITFIRYVSGITFIRYVSGITFIRYVSGITFIRYAQNRKVGKAKLFKVLGSNKTKGHKQNSQNPLRSPTMEHTNLKEQLYI